VRAPLAVVAAVATAAGVVIAVPGGAGAVTLPSPSLSPLPSVSVGLPTLSPTPLPLPSTSVTDDPGGTVGDVTDPVTGGGGSGDDGSGSGTTSGTAGSTTTGTTSGTSGAGSVAGSAKDPLTKREKRAQDSTPMVAGTAAARDLVDDEHSPAMRAAGQAFLDADQAIAEIARQKRVMAELKQDALEQAQVYKALDTDVTNAETVATDFHARWDSVRHEMVKDARTAYVTGEPTTDDDTAVGLFDAVGRLGDSATRADLRLGSLQVLREVARADFQRIADRYNTLKHQVEAADKRLDALAAQRTAALEAVRAARSGDVALNHARIAESGELGAQIEAASAQLQRSGETVQGTGEFGHPADGIVTSPFGLRYHPILHYRKLHTGTDFAGGGGAIRAADTGRVIMTVVSEAYGNFTVIDHGVIDGHRVTTAYAHQSQFLVREGQRVEKGQQIGVIGSTGYSTGPHLHFEVRENGTVVDPLTWLARR
jgi:murein DD-endopeptidase MepM/ murein hydrolase activator NlpD